jgi:hypothetical protein
MSLLEAYTGVRIMETNDNYARADTPLLAQPEILHTDIPSYFHDFEQDQRFWEKVFSDPEGVWGMQVSFGKAALSEWVARVPGLFWKPEAEQLRQLSPTAIENKSERWTTYTPWGKSQKVMGGIGAFRLPPAVDGTRLVTLTTSLNASAGVPALVLPDVWDKIRQAGSSEGRAINGQVRWQPMAQGWAARFKSTRDSPRGYLVLDNPNAIEVLDEKAPTQFHPFTVMEYYSGSRELFDYVYATADTGLADYRGQLTRFFDMYKDVQGRHGRYLLAGDMVNALWEAEYDSPADLRRADPSAQSQLALVEARVRERLLGEDTIEWLLEVSQ